MFSSVLGRQRRSRRRVDGGDEGFSPSARQLRRQFTNRSHATADFTEADDDDEDDDFNEEGMSRLDNDADNQNEDPLDDEDDEERPLPVLPLFSASHLGICTILSSFGFPLVANRSHCQIHSPCIASPTQFE